MRCSKCGKILENNASYCESCGHKVEPDTFIKHEDYKKNTLIIVISMLLGIISIILSIVFLLINYYVLVLLPLCFVGLILSIMVKSKVSIKVSAISINIVALLIIISMFASSNYIERRREKNNRIVYDNSIELKRE